MKLSMNVIESKTLREKFLIKIKAKFCELNENNHKKIVVAASGKFLILFLFCNDVIKNLN